jgi:hypothetical protein
MDIWLLGIKCGTIKDFEISYGFCWSLVKNHSMPQFREIKVYYLTINFLSTELMRIKKFLKINLRFKLCVFYLSFMKFWTYECFT